MAEGWDYYITTAAWKKSVLGWTHGVQRRYWSRKVTSSEAMVSISLKAFVFPATGNGGSTISAQPCWRMRMKHDLEAFSREIVSLIKMSGDTGGGGDKSRKPLPHRDFFVPTRQAAVSPLALDTEDTTFQRLGTAKVHLEAVTESVPSVYCATTCFGSPNRWKLTGVSLPNGMQLAGLNQRGPADLALAQAVAWLALRRRELPDTLGRCSALLGWTSLDLFRSIRSRRPRDLT